MANPTSGRMSWVLVLVLLAAIAIGAAASVLVSPAASSSSSPQKSPTAEVILPVWVFVASVLGIMGVIIVTWVLVRVDSPGKGVSNTTFVIILAAVVMICLAIIGLRVLGVGGPANQSGTGPASTGSSGGSNTSSSGGGGNLVGPGSFFVFPSIPAWLPLAVLAVVVLVAVAVAIPQVRRYVADRRDELRHRSRPRPPDAEKVRAALTRASEDLDLGGDPRTVILALYSEMLVHLGPMVGSVATATPEEIRVGPLKRLGVRSEEARTLTRLFEEARYSLHPMGPEASVRARTAVQATIADLDRRAVPA